MDELKTIIENMKRNGITLRHLVGIIKDLYRKAGN